VALTAESPRLARRRDLAPVLGMAAGVLVVHIVLSGRYGFHHDELYLLASGRHPALGYVDQPPVVPLVARGLTLALGEHLWPLRVVAGVAHAGLVVVVALVAGALGGRQRALVLAGLAAAVTPGFVAAGSRLGPASLGLLWVALAVLAVVRILGGADERWWLAAGAALGAGLDTSRTTILLLAGLTIGLAAVPGARRQLRSGWWWAGMAVAVLVWSPHLAWQAGHGWPLFDVAGSDSPWGGGDGPAGVIVRQLVVAGPVGLVVAGAGLAWEWRQAAWRPLAVAAVVFAVGIVALGAPGAEMTPAYVVALPAGAVAADVWAGSVMRRWHQVVAGVLANGLVLLPAMAPVFPVGTYGDLYHEDVDASLGEEVGWPDMVALVARIYEILPAEERVDARIVTARAGEAAAIDLYGPERGLPRGTALSAHGGSVAWWPDGEPAGTVIFVHYARQDLEPYCDAMGPIAIVGNPLLLPNDTAGATISLCRTLRVSPNELREALRRGG
jgi:hypothetical protein